MKAPVPPAQEPFIRSSRVLPKKMILASSPQLDDSVRLGDEGTDGGGGGVDLLDKVQPSGLGHPQARRAGDEQPHLLPPSRPVRP